MTTRDLESEKVAVIDWFIKHNPPSVGPQTSLHLLELSTKVQAEINKDPKTPEAIKAYVVALHMVAKVGHIQQGVVIAELTNALGNKGKQP